MNYGRSKMPKKNREKTPPAVPTPRTLNGRMIDAKLVKCATCRNEMVFAATQTRNFNKRVAEQMAINNKWRLIGGKWHCHACALAIAFPKTSEAQSPSPH